MDSSIEQVKLVNVSKHFSRSTGDIIAGLHNVDLTITQGEVVGVIGTNGAGKSTLFNCLTGQLKIDEGEIYLGGDEISHMKPLNIARKIGRVFQDPRMGTAPRMTVFENLMLALKRGEKRGFSRSLNDDNYQKMIDYLKPFRLDLENRLDVPIENLSGGQRQTVSLVMATLQAPELLLLDEHTAALDPRTAKQVMAMTQDLIKKLNLTTLMITHHLQDALTYSDRIIVMHQGQISHIYEKSEIPHLTTADLFQMIEQLSGVALDDEELSGATIPS